MISPDHLSRLKFYSPVSFLRVYEEEITEAQRCFLEESVEKGNILTWGSTPVLYYRYLSWDSDYFQVPTYRIDFASWDTATFTDSMLASTYRELVGELTNKHDSCYLFAEVPSEDLATIRAMNIAEFRLVETRLTYYHNDVQNYASAERYPVREAGELDIENLKDVARRARNGFDRLHADPFFTMEVADEYLATYIENSIRGLADVVIVPDLVGHPGAFTTGKYDDYHGSICSLSMAKIALSAVAPERRGWYVRLVSELTYWFKERDIRIVYVTTQATNRAVIQVMERLGYSFGRCSHVFALGLPALGEKNE